LLVFGEGRMQRPHLTIWCLYEVIPSQLADVFMREWLRCMGIFGIVAVVLATAWLTGGCETAEGLVGLALDKLR
jgi:hypothetical protein